MNFRSDIASALALLRRSASGLHPPLKMIVMEVMVRSTNVHLHHAKEPVIKAEGADGKPVTGAVVSFVAPVNGAGATFLDGQSTTWVASDASGIAVGRGIKPDHGIGEFQIRVVASYQGESAVARITQTNAEPAAASNDSRKIVLITLIGGNSGSKSTAAAALGTTISAGAPGFGTPQ